MAVQGRAEALERMSAYINKELGGKITTAGEIPPPAVGAIPTGIPGLDTAPGKAAWFDLKF